MFQFEGSCSILVSDEQHFGSLFVTITHFHPLPSSLLVQTRSSRSHIRGLCLQVEMPDILQVLRLVICLFMCVCCLFRCQATKAKLSASNVHTDWALATALPLTLVLYLGRLLPLWVRYRADVSPPAAQSRVCLVTSRIRHG